MRVREGTTVVTDKTGEKNRSGSSHVTTQGWPRVPFPYTSYWPRPHWSRGNYGYPRGWRRGKTSATCIHTGEKETGREKHLSVRTGRSGTVLNEDEGSTDCSRSFWDLRWRKKSFLPSKPSCLNTVSSSVTITSRTNKIYYGESSSKEGSPLVSRFRTSVDWWNSPEHNPLPRWL